MDILTALENCEREGDTVLFKKAAYEIKRLRRENAGLELDCAAWKQSNDLKRDVINQLCEQIIEAEEYNGLHQRACLEIERLRTALDEIVMTCNCDAIETARAALENSKS